MFRIANYTTKCLIDATKLSFLLPQGKKLSSSAFELILIALGPSAELNKTGLQPVSRPVERVPYLGVLKRADTTLKKTYVIGSFS